MARGAEQAARAEPGLVEQQEELEALGAQAAKQDPAQQPGWEQEQERSRGRATVLAQPQAHQMGTWGAHLVQGRAA